MDRELTRRSFLRIAGASLGVGVLYQFTPLFGNNARANPIGDFYRQANGEAPSAFTFAQFSDTHVGFAGPPDPLGTQAFEDAVRLLNQAPQRPDLVIFTGDLTHDAPKPEIHSERMRQFKLIAARLKTPILRMVPGENDAALDGGVLYSEHFGAMHYSFDHRGVHFIALDNVSHGRPELGAEQLAWLRQDLARFPKTAPIIVFTHRPLFDLKPEWEWFTRDGNQAMNLLAPYENVSVLYGHIHRHDVRSIGKIPHYATRSLIFAFNDPALAADKKPLPFDQSDPFKELGIRLVSAPLNAPAALSIRDVQLTRTEFAGLSGIQQITTGKPAAGALDDAD